jgi:hypothetical protein
LTNYDGTSDWDLQFYYVKNPTVGTGHTFSIAGNDRYTSYNILAFSGTDTAETADQQNGAVGSSPIQPGSVTPSTNNQVVVTAVVGPQTSVTVNSGFTEVIDGDGGGWWKIGVAYLIQTTATAVNPTWTASGTGTNMVAAIASFKGNSPGAH